MNCLTAVTVCSFFINDIHYEEQVLTATFERSVCPEYKIYHNFSVGLELSYSIIMQRGAGSTSFVLKLINLASLVNDNNVEINQVWYSISTHL